MHVVVRPRPWLRARSAAPSPASLAVETMPYPATRPDPSVFEPVSDEYAAVAGPRRSTPPTPSETLASLVRERDFRAAELLRREMASHRVPIPRDALYLRAALHAISVRRPRGSAHERLEAFGAWLSLVPDRDQGWQSFHDIRQKLFLSMDHLNVSLIYRFGLVLASKGYYSGDAAMQVVSTLARYARASVVERYLREVEDHASKTTALPSDSLAAAYSLAVRTVALGGKSEAALSLVSTARSRGIRVSDFTLHIVAKHAPERQAAIDRIRAAYPAWTPQDMDSRPVECPPLSPERSADISALAARLRSLRVALRSPSPPSPHVLHSFVSSCQALGRTRVPTLLRALAYRHSPKSASTWVFAEMLHHRSRREHVHVLFVFSRHFHPVGVPRKTLLSLVRGARGQQSRKERVRRWVDPLCPMNEKLWPSAYHTALVWEAIVSLSPKTEKERLYALLLSLVRESTRPERGWDGSDSRGRVPEAGQARLQLPPDTYDAVHFSSFVSSWARKNPARAAEVLRDMLHLGIEPSSNQWSMVARAYAQHGDPGVAFRILDRFEDVERQSGKDGDDAVGSVPSDALLGIHTNVLRGFVIAGDVEHAQEVETRLVTRFGYRSGERPATDAALALLRTLERRLGSSPS